MPDTFTRRRMHQRASTNADQAEAAAILRSSATVDAGTFDERISGAMDDFDPEIPEADIEEWHETDLTVDLLVGETQAEIERRVELLGDAYPFSLDGNNLSYTASRTGYYEFCLAISLSPSITKGEYVALPRQFERTAATLVKQYMGWKAEALHIGWPRDDAIGPRFRAAAEMLHRLTGEWVWGPDYDLPDDPLPQNIKDEGVDFVVWKRALDRRSGHLFLLCQCACGDDWVDKLTELSVPRFKAWFNPLCLIDPVRSFATPFILSDGNTIDAHRQAGMVFDRVRLALIAEGHYAEPGIAGLRPITDPLAAMVLTAA